MSDEPKWSSYPTEQARELEQKRLPQLPPPLLNAFAAALVAFSPIGTTTATYVKNAMVAISHDESRTRHRYEILSKALQDLRAIKDRERGPAGAFAGWADRVGKALSQRGLIGLGKWALEGNEPMLRSEVEKLAKEIAAIEKLKAEDSPNFSFAFSLLFFLIILDRMSSRKPLEATGNAPVTKESLAANLVREIIDLTSRTDPESAKVLNFKILQLAELVAGDDTLKAIFEEIDAEIGKATSKDS